VGFLCRELHRGYFIVERFWSMEVKVSQLVFFQLRWGLGLVKSTSGCSEVIWNVTTLWSEPVGFSSSMAQLDTSLATDGAAIIRSRTKEPVPFLKEYVGVSGMLTGCYLYSSISMMSSSALMGDLTWEFQRG
jgi:hypothetical protein